MAADACRRTSRDLPRTVSRRRLALLRCTRHRSPGSAPGDRQALNGVDPVWRTAWSPPIPVRLRRAGRLGRGLVRCLAVLHARSVGQPNRVAGVRAGRIAHLLLRQADAIDEQAVIEVVRAAMGTYSDWCPGWSLPHDMEARERARWQADDSSLQRLVACLGEQIVGVSVSKRAPIAVLSLLMVAPCVWGTGVATGLHYRALQDAATCSSNAIRLTVPEGNGRARRFYEKNGWQRTSAAPQIHSWLRLPMLEYTRDLRTLESAAAPATV